MLYLRKEVNDTIHTEYIQSISGGVNKENELLKKKQSSFFNAPASQGFTLAEVLITLAVIGVVASLTIPALMKSNEKARIVSGVKKYQSVFSQAIMNYSVDNDCVGNLAACGAFTGGWDAAGHQQVWDALKPYFKTVKDCGTAAGQGCFALGVMYKLLNGKDYSVYDNGNSAKSVLLDGAAIYTNGFNGNCARDIGRGNNSVLENSCGHFGIDINGQKGPNQLGRDFFHWYITKSGQVVPCGGLDDHFYTAADGTPHCDPGDTAGGGTGDPGGGIGCAGYVMMNNSADYLD